MTPIIASRGGVSARAFGFGSLVAPLGDYQAITTATVDSGGASSITFSSIPSTYKHLQIRYIARCDYAGISVNLLYKINSDATTANYSYHILRGDGSSATAAGGTSLNLMSNDTITGATSASGIYGAGIIDILDYANTSKYKTFRSLTGYDANGSGLIRLASSLWMSTAAITSLYFENQGGSQYAAGTQFALYGIK